MVSQHGLASRLYLKHCLIDRHYSRAIGLFHSEMSFYRHKVIAECILYGEKHYIQVRVLYFRCEVGTNITNATITLESCRIARKAYGLNLE
jgi:hypothetical protein